MLPGPQRCIDILMVEDNQGDAELASEAFANACLSNRLKVVEDGEQALNYLRRQPPFDEATRPDLVLLDVNLPGLGGLDVLRIIKDDQTLCQIPVVMLSSSSARRDIELAYQRHANCYVQKPMSFDRYVEVVQALQGFWAGVVTLPTHRD